MVISYHIMQSGKLAVATSCRNLWENIHSCVVHVIYTLLTSFEHFAGYLLRQLAISRLTVVSREAKKKQHARASSGLRDHYSELFTRMAALKF